MVYFMENPIKMDDLGAKNSIFGNTHMNQQEKKTKLFFQGWTPEVSSGMNHPNTPRQPELTWNP